MSRVVVDASVAIKWVVEEHDTQGALAVLEKFSLSAPDLIISECANILWKKVRRGELVDDEAALAANLLQRADVEIVPTKSLMDVTIRLAVEIDHAAYDCVYLALALANGWSFVTADDRLRRKLTGFPGSRFDGIILSINEAADLEN